jgi:hypothetical protein
MVSGKSSTGSVVKFWFNKLYVKESEGRELSNLREKT